MVSQELPIVATATSRAASRSRLPLEFEPNVGQAAPEIRFLGRSEGMTLLFQADRVDLVAEGGRVGLRFVDAEPGLEPAPSEPTGGRSHYFQGTDPNHWRVGVPRFAALRYPGVYPGIDAVFRDNGSTTEYDFFVAPGADPRAIRLILEGADEVSLEPSGDVVVLAGRQRMVQRAPVLFQQDGLGRLAVEGGWEVRDDGTLGFRIGAYDPARTLVIDPVVDFSTYIGGSGGDAVNGIAVDGEGYIFLTGSTLSVNFPLQDPFDITLSGSSDAFIAKLDPSGRRLIFSTYFGGTNTDAGYEIALGPGGDVHVAGATASIDFPTVTAFQNSFGGGAGDAFVARFDPTGAVLERSSYLGGSGSGGDLPVGLSVDGSGGVFVSGLVQSSDFPVTGGAFQTAYGGSGDVFVTKVGASGSLVYSSYLGGSDFDTGGANAIDSSGNVYVVGSTWSSDFPVINGLDDTFSGGVTDGFVAKISPTGAALVWSTFLGGSGNDGASGVDLDQSRNVYVTGQTGSADFPVDDDIDPTFGGGLSDGFATKLDPTGTSILSRPISRSRGRSTRSSAAPPTASSSSSPTRSGCSSPPGPVPPGSVRSSERGGRRRPGSARGPGSGSLVDPGPRLPSASRAVRGEGQTEPVAGRRIGESSIHRLGQRYGGTARARRAHWGAGRHPRP
jgi:hypothetical protein